MNLDTNGDVSPLRRKCLRDLHPETQKTTIHAGSLHEVLKKPDRRFCGL